MLKAYFEKGVPEKKETPEKKGYLKLELYSLGVPRF